MLDRGESWVVNHDDKDMNWFITNDDKLPDLRSLFKHNNAPNTFRGCLIFSKEDLCSVARDLVTYPYVFSYKNLDVSHGKLPFIIKATGHLTLDLLSTDKALLSDVANDESLSSFLRIPYRGRQ